MIVLDQAAGEPSLDRDQRIGPLDRGFSFSLA